MSAFTSDKSVKEKLTTCTSSGAISFNDVIIHFAGKCITFLYTRAHTHAHIHTLHAYMPPLV